MIREALTLLLLLHTAPALAETAAVDEVVAAPVTEVEASPVPAAEPVTKVPDDSLELHRTPLEVLTERMIGSASKSVRFDWRKTTVGVGALGSQLSELNNFGSARTGAFVRTPIGGLMGELAVTRAFTWSTDSTEKLARTPYRQHGRPSRFELDINVAFPLAEGVVTAWPGFFPATELVFSANAGFRYLFYPGELSGAGVRETVQAVFSPRLTERELENLEDERPPGMQVDEGRYGLLLGFATDVYFQNGLFVFPRALVAVPLFTPVSGTKLGFWWELTFGLGLAI